MTQITAEILEKIYKPRKTHARKYDFGHLLIIGGSKLYHGSPTLNALAAFKCGVDLVTIVAPKRPADIIATFSPDLISYPIDTDFFSEKNLDEVLQFLPQKTAVVIGGGIGRTKETLDFILAFLENCSLPTVIDADAIHAVVKRKNVIAGKPFVLTPHAYEFKILTGIEVSFELDSRIAATQKAAADLQTTILLKGAVDIISDGKKVALNKTGNPFMTVGGTGDTLAGICGSLLAQKIEPFEAACAAAFINGRAGDLAAEKYKVSLTASDLLNFIPQVVNKR